MVRAIVSDSRAELPVCTWVHGQYGIRDVYLGVLAVLGRAGVISVVERDLHPLESRALRAAAELTRPRQIAVRQLARERWGGQP
jgi:malate/lactate dehydrogenase